MFEPYMLSYKPFGFEFDPTVVPAEGTVHFYFGNAETPPETHSHLLVRKNKHGEGFDCAIGYASPQDPEKVTPLPAIMTNRILGLLPGFPDDGEYVMGMDAGQMSLIGNIAIGLSNDMYIDYQKKQAKTAGTSLKDLNGESISHQARVSQLADYLVEYTEMRIKTVHELTGKLPQPYF